MKKLLLLILLWLLICGFIFDRYHDLTLTTCEIGGSNDVVIKYFDPEISASFGSLSAHATAGYGDFSKKFPKLVEVSWTNAEGERVSKTKKFPKNLAKRIRENGDELYIIIRNKNEWDFGYKIKNGFFSFLEIIGESEEERRQRKIAKELIEAAFEGNINIVKSLANNSNLNINHNLIGSSITPLAASIHFLSKNKKKEITEFLLSNGAIPGIEVMWAAREADIPTLELFLQHGADLNYYQPHSGQYSPLIAAIDEGHFNVVKWLIENGADVNRAIYNNLTPIYSAALNNDVEIAEYLLAHGANQNVVISGTGSYPLDAAKRNKNTKMIKLLLEANARKNI